MRRDGRVVDGGGLENHCGGNSTGGSNPSPSAKSLGKLSIQQRERMRIRCDSSDVVRFLSVSFYLRPFPVFFSGSITGSVGSVFTYAASRSTPAFRSLSLTML